MAGISAYLIQGMGFGLAAAAQPGPFQTYLISQTLKLGWRRALPAALAPLISDGPIILLALLLLSRLPAWFERFLHLAGGLFILYLALTTAAAWRRFDDSVGKAPSLGQPTRLAGVLRAALINALNPYPYIYWSLVTGPILRSGWQKAPVNGVAFLASLYATLILCLMAIIAAFGSARRFGPRVNRLLLGISAFVLAGFGIVQLVLGIVGGHAG